MKTVVTYWAKIFCGLREGYDGPEHHVGEVERICQRFVDQVGLCVTVTPTTFVYKNGREQGAIVGLINYPRFPSTMEELRHKAFALALLLKRELKQLRVSVMFPHDTVMLEDGDGEGDL
jgi:hypothetical protein